MFGDGILRVRVTRITCGRHLSLTVIQFVGKLNKLQQTTREKDGQIERGREGEKRRESDLNQKGLGQKHNGIEQKSKNSNNNDQFIVVESTRMLLSACVYLKA